MKTRAVRLYGANDLRLDEYELPAMASDEILAEIVSDSICMSTYKETVLGSAHKRVPDDIAENPIIVGHEFSGRIIDVGEKWRGQFDAGDLFTVQPNINYMGMGRGPGYSFPNCGGAATYVLLHPAIAEKNCVLKHSAGSCYAASLAEPISCLLAGLKAFYHTDPDAAYIHRMGIVPGGKMAILAGCGPMGLGAVDLALHCDVRPALLVVTDISEERLSRAKEIFPPDAALAGGTELMFVNTAKCVDPVRELRDISGGGFDDVFVFAPVTPVVETADKILGRDGCLNFFAGPTDSSFTVGLNYYNVHYSGTHVVGTSGGNTADMREALDLASAGRINPACMVTHIVGLDNVADVTQNLPKVPGGKKLSYTHIDLPLTAIDDFERLGRTDARFAKLHKLCAKSAGLWNPEAEKYLLENF